METDQLRKGSKTKTMRHTETDLLSIVCTCLSTRLCWTPTNVFILATLISSSDFFHSPVPRCGEAALYVDSTRKSVCAGLGHLKLASSSGHMIMALLDRQVICLEGGWKFPTAKKCRGSTQFAQAHFSYSETSQQVTNWTLLRTINYSEDPTWD